MQCLVFQRSKGFGAALELVKECWGCERRRLNGFFDTWSVRGTSGEDMDHRRLSKRNRFLHGWGGRDHLLFPGKLYQFKVA